MRRAFTLIEILTCIAIVVVIAAITMPVFITAKRSALRADETSRLRQIGIGFGLYEEDSGHQQYGTRVLVSEGYIPSSLLNSALDPTEKGIANQIAEEITKELSHFHESVPYRSSFPAFLVFGQFNETFEKVMERPNAGWLVSLSDTKTRRTDSYLGAVEGQYLRLTLDGAILHRKTRWFPVNDSRPDMVGYSPYFLFADFTLDDMKKVLF